ncbi:MAG: efflux RND transporter periplasmic adaptor subunit [Pseudolabrys sp.]|nr:efflux RND transporter periplasmic adaptor subunit [Pseudolabrys sp.]MDP2295208.1 efflux RND transporter periplasmic adaptor subunit [Pseudolabrys sp.]
MGRRVFWTAIGAVSLIAAGGWVFMQYPQSFAGIIAARAPTAGAQPQAQPPRGGGIAVETAPVALDTVIEDIRAIGTLGPNESVVISTEISGRIARIGFREGEKVKAGDVLIELDATMLQAELDKVRSDLALAKANNERALTLAKQGITTTRARDEAEAAYQAAQANIALAEARLQKTTLTAPLTGVVGLRTVSTGAYVIPGQRIVELVEVDPLKVDFRVPELFAAQLRADQTILVSADAVPDKTFEGKITAIDPIVDVNGRAIRLRARVPNPDGLLSPGFFVRIRIVVDRRENAMLVPESAIFPLDGKTLVYRVVNGRAVQTEVVLGQRLPGLVEVRKGLSATDVVVRAGQQRLREGAPVRVVASGGGAT